MLYKILSFSLILFGLYSCKNEYNPKIKEIPCEIFYDPSNFFHPELRRVSIPVDLRRVGKFTLNCDGFIIDNNCNELIQCRIIFQNLEFTNNNEIYFQYLFPLENLTVKGILVKDNKTGSWNRKDFSQIERQVKL